MKGNFLKKRLLALAICCGVILVSLSMPVSAVLPMPRFRLGSSKLLDFGRGAKPGESYQAILELQMLNSDSGRIDVQISAEDPENSWLDLPESPYIISAKAGELLRVPLRMNVAKDAGDFVDHVEKLNIAEVGSGGEREVFARISGQTQGAKASLVPIKPKFNHHITLGPYYDFDFLLKNDGDRAVLTFVEMTTKPLFSFEPETVLIDDYYMVEPGDELVVDGWGGDMDSMFPPMSGSGLYLFNMSYSYVNELGETITENTKAKCLYLAPWAAIVSLLLLIAVILMLFLWGLKRIKGLKCKTEHKEVK